MRAITVRQPWAWAIVHGSKDVENRARNIAGSYRGPVAIHAGLDLADEDAPIWEMPEYREALASAPALIRHRLDARGEIIGIVDLADVHTVGDDGCKPPAMCSPWALRQEDFPTVVRPDYLMAHLVFANPRPLAKPIPYKGALGLWTLPDDVLAGAL